MKNNNFFIFIMAILFASLFFLIKPFSRNSDAENTTKEDSNKKNVSFTDKEKELDSKSQNSSKPLSTTEQMRRLVAVPDNVNMSHQEFQELLKNNLDEVLAYLNTVEFPDPGSDEAFNQIMYVAKNLDQYFKHQSFDEAVSALEGIKGSPYLYEATLQEIIGNSVGRHEGRDTEQYAQIYDWVKSNPDTVAAQNGGTSVGGMLYLSEPEHGWQRAMELPEGRIRREAITAIMTQRYAENIGEASEILAELEPSPDLDHAVLNLVRSGLRQDVEHDILADWSINITDEDMRNESLYQAIDSWQKENPEGLAQWIQQKSQEAPDLKPYLSLFHKQAQNSQN